MSSFRQAQGPRGLGPALAKLTRPAYKRRGFAHGDVLARWAVIVGETLAATSCPERLSFPTGAGAGATLQIRVASGFALELQHLTPLVMERINTFYGYRAVTRLKLVQGPLPARQKTRSRDIKPLAPHQEDALSQQLSTTADVALHAALRSLGRAVRGADPKES